MKRPLSGYGKNIYYQTQDEQGITGIWPVSAEGGEPELKITSDDPLLKLGFYNFCADNQRLYFSFHRVEDNVWIMDFISSLL